jgi:hypothetical protein
VGDMIATSDDDSWGHARGVQLGWGHAAGYSLVVQPGGGVGTGNTAAAGSAAGGVLHDQWPAGQVSCENDIATPPSTPHAIKHTTHTPLQAPRAG